MNCCNKTIKIYKSLTILIDFYRLLATVRNQNMLTKLSIGNVKRSFSDYVIYFLTLTFGVSLFYAFNSIGAQEVILDLSVNQKELLKGITKLLGVVSIFISFVLAFLILYANQFLVKRRKKELGLYQTLGMSKFNISRLFVMETLTIGLFSLISGLILGVLMSQGFAVIASSLFDTEILQYRFIFSIEAMIKTIFYFAVIFLLVMIFNIIVISRFTLLELLYGSKKNEVIKIQNSKLNFSLFVLSNIFIIVGYMGFVRFGLRQGVMYPVVFGGFVVIGTFLWFFSLAGFLIQVIQNKKNVYFKDLNIFILRQISSKINTNFVSMSVICFMLVGTITILSTGFSYKKAMDKELKIVTPYDVSFSTFIWEGEEVGKITKTQKMLERNGISLKELGEYLDMFMYNPNLDASQVLEPYITKNQYNEYFGENTSNKVYALSKKNYENLVKLQGEKPVSIKDDEVAIFTNKGNMVEGFQRFIDNAKDIKIGDKKYRIANDKVQLLSIENTNVPRNKMMVVLPDNDVKHLKKAAELVVANYTKDTKNIDKKLTELFNSFTSREGGLKCTGGLPEIKTYIIESSQMYTGSIIFLGIYVGIIFLVSSAVILTLQQLSEASDNLSRYRTLKRIGVTQESIHRVIFRQVFVYFMLPLLLAIIHSAIAISIINKVALETTKASILIPSFTTGCILVIVYGGYFLATYKSYKAIVK